VLRERPAHGKVTTHPGGTATKGSESNTGCRKKAVVKSLLQGRDMWLYARWLGLDQVIHLTPLLRNM